MAIIKRTERTDAEIDDVLNKAIEKVDEGASSWPGMTYEEGVYNAIQWILGDSDSHPMEDG